MNISPLSDTRHLVPRWRSLAATLQSRELASYRSSGQSNNHKLSDELVMHLERWRTKPSLIAAAELVDIAILEGQENEAIDAARRLVLFDLSATPLIRDQAARLLARTGQEPELYQNSLIRRNIPPGYWRRLTREYPDNALAWVELSLQHTVAGNHRDAQRCMAVATRLAPDNRHVLRSSSRLALHLGDPEQAHDILLGSEASKSDPWIIAAEIALAKVADRNPRRFKTGLGILDEGGLYPRQITELAGAIATVDLLDGNRKRSKKLFRASMTDPTGSALAQGEWATPLIGAEIVPIGALTSTLEAHEAKALHFWRERRFLAAADACERWASVDSFSIRPFEFAATTANILEDYDRANQFASRGLMLRKEAPMLLLSKVFSLASLNKVDEASKILRKVLGSTQDEKTRFIALANEGLISFRKGDLEFAKARYKESIDGFNRMRYVFLGAQAEIYMARESFIANDKDSLKLLENARKTMERIDKHNLSETSIILKSVERLFESNKHTSESAIS